MTLLLCCLSFTSTHQVLISNCCLATRYLGQTLCGWYMHCVSSKAVSTIRAMGQALTALEMWMASNRLCLNPSRTKFIWLGTQQQLPKLDLTDISSQFHNCFLLLGPRPRCHTEPGTFLCASSQSPHSCLLLPVTSASHCCSFSFTSCCSYPC